MIFFTTVSYTNLVESAFLGLATDRPELEPSLDFVRLSPFTGLQKVEYKLKQSGEAEIILLMQTPDKHRYRYTKKIKRKVVLLDLILYIPSTIFQLNRDRSSWVEQVLSWDKCVLLKDHNAVTLVRLEPAASRSRVKHSTTEPLHSYVKL